MTRRRQPAPLTVRYHVAEGPVDTAALDAAVRELARALVRHALGQNNPTNENEPYRPEPGTEVP